MGSLGKEKEKEEPFRLILDFHTSMMLLGKLLRLLGLSGGMNSVFLGAPLETTVLCFVIPMPLIATGVRHYIFNT